MTRIVDWEAVAEELAKELAEKDRTIRTLKREIEVKDLRIAQLIADARPTLRPGASGEYKAVGSK